MPHPQAPASHHHHCQATDTKHMVYSSLQMLRCLMQQPTAIRCSVRLYGLQHKTVHIEILAEAAAETLAGIQVLVPAAMPTLIQGWPPPTHSTVIALNRITDQTCTAGHQGTMTDQAEAIAMPVIMRRQQLPTTTGTTGMRDNQALDSMMHKRFKCLDLAPTQMQEHSMTDTLVADLTARGTVIGGNNNQTCTANIGSTVTGRVTQMTTEGTKGAAETLTVKATAGNTGKRTGDHTGLMTEGPAEGKRHILAVTDRRTGAIVSVWSLMTEGLETVVQGTAGGLGTAPLP